MFIKLLLYCLLFPDIGRLIVAIRTKPFRKDVFFIDETFPPEVSYLLPGMWVCKWITAIDLTYSVSAFSWRGQSGSEFAYCNCPETCCKSTLSTALWWLHCYSTATPTWDVVYTPAYFDEIESYSQVIEAHPFSVLQGWSISHNLCYMSVYKLLLLFSPL